MRSARELAQAIAPSAVRAAGAVRRMAISVTAKALWQLIGHKLPGGDETFSAEVFSGIGFYARPATGGKPEAIVLNVGDAKAPVIVATRDEKTRAAVAGGLQPNETAMFNDAAIVVLKANGTIEARSKSGAAVALATLADVQAMRTTYNAHTHPDPASGFTGAPVQPMAAPTGTSKFKAE